ncbi:MAG: LemA family protein [Candidatus Vogelbacteria bacterium]|nr:LemA family protein [Candidatus Vogelbacteria bacterium]
MSKKWWVVIAVVVVVLGYWLTTYNRFVGLDQGLQGQWAQVETQYQRRFDLIPNLVNSVKGAMKQEQAVFDVIAEARTRYGDAKSVDEKVLATNQVESSLARLLVVMENYPQLKSIDTVGTLMVQIEGTENRIGVERGRFNDAVKVYNTYVQMFPSSLIARLSGFSGKAYFESAKGAEVAPTVSL